MILFVLPYQKLHAQSREKSAIDRLTEEGFEEIRIIQEGNNVICTIERGLFRTPAEDFRNTLLQLKKVYPDSCNFQVILLEQGQPVYQLTENSEVNKDNQLQKNDSEQLKSHLLITYYDKATYQLIKNEKVNNAVHTGLTLTIYPQVKMMTFKFNQIYEKQFNLAPTLQYSGWKGMLMTGQVIFPLYNEISYTEDFIRPGFVTFSQNFTLPKLNSINFTAGNFNANRYGLDLRWKKFFQRSNWSFGANIGLTGDSYIYDRYWKHGSLKTISWKVKAGYFLPIYQLQADLQVGQFLVKDQGFRFDVYRHFGEATIGAWVVSSGGGHNGGFHFAFPLDPLKRKHKNKLRVKLPDNYDNEYFSRNFYVYGRYYETQPDENRSVQDLPPKFINNIFFNP